MRRMGISVCAVALVPLVGIGWAPAAGAQPAGTEEPTNILVGKIVDVGGEMPAGQATVRMLHLGTGSVYSTLTTEDTGSYIMTELPDGSYELSVESDGNHYFSEEILTLAGGMRIRASFVLKRQTPSPQMQQRLAARGLDNLQIDGIAEMLKEDVAGIPGAGGHGGRMTAYILSGVGGGFLLYELLKDEDVSPFSP